MNCPQCGKKLKGDWPDKSTWFNCDYCGDRFLLKNNELLNINLRGRHISGQQCANCGQPLNGGKYTAPWADGNNSDGYIKCPHCGYVNFQWED